MSRGITEPVTEGCSPDWLGGLGLEIFFGLTIALGAPAAERPDFKQVFLFDRMQTDLLSGERDKSVTS